MKKLRNPCRAETKGRLPEGKGAKPWREQVSGEGLVANLGHVHEIQVYR